MLNLCPLCSSDNINEIYTTRDMPIFQNKVYDSIEDSKKVETNNLALCNCNNCSFVFNKEFNSSIMNYDVNYQNEQNYSTFFKNYLNDIIKYLEIGFSKEDKIVEIGTGKGYFLNLLENTGFKNVIGFDPAYEGKKENVIKDYYSNKYKDINADLIILRHTLEHISEPFKFLKEIAEVNNYSGKVFIEVPCFDWIKEKEAFWDIFYEHCNYFTKDSLKSMFNNSEVGELFNGQYIYLLADLKEIREYVESTNIDKFEKLFSHNFKSYLKTIQNRKFAIWGAGAKGVTFLNILDKEMKYVEYVVDINPKKQNKYLAKTSHKIIGVEYLKTLIDKKEIDGILIMNENYKFEIINELSEYNLNFKILGETNE